MWYSAGFISHLSFGMVNCALNNTFKKSKTATHAAVSFWKQLHTSKVKKNGENKERFPAPFSHLLTTLTTQFTI